jgi:hypothetical protein
MNCNYCKYTTEIKCNYQKHLSSNKHKKMYEEYKLKYNTKTENKDILENNEEENFIKNYEFKISKKVNNKIKENVESDSDSESENENNKIANNDNNICIYGNTKLIVNDDNKLCIYEENKLIENKDKLLMDLFTNVARIANDMKSMRLEMNQTGKIIVNETKQIREDTKEIKNDTKIIKQHLLTILNDKYKDNPSIKKINKKEYTKLIQDFTKLKINDTQFKLQKRLLSLFRNKKLVYYIVEMLIPLVKKENYNLQSVFNVDASRIIYATKIKQNWHNDKMGLKLREYIIKPLADYIIETIDLYSNFIKTKIDGPNQNIDNYKINIEILDFISYIKNKKTENNICKQLCPHLIFETIHK